MSAAPLLAAALAAVAIGTAAGDSPARAKKAPLAFPTVPAVTTPAAETPDASGATGESDRKKAKGSKRRKDRGRTPTPAATAPAPDPGTVARREADAAYAIGDWDRARRRYEEALRLGVGTDDPALLYNLAIADVQLALGDRAKENFGKARALLTARLEKTPDRPAISDVYYLTAIANHPSGAQIQGGPFEWRSFASKAVATWRAGGYGRTVSGADLFRLSKILEFLGDAEAQAVMDRSVAAFEKEGPDKTYFPAALAQRGAAALQAGDAARAESLYARATAANPYVSGGFFNLGMAQVALGKLDEAEKSFAQGVYRDRRYIPECNYLARLLGTMNRYRREHPGAPAEDLRGRSREDLEAAILDAASEAVAIRTRLLTAQGAGEAALAGDEAAFREAQNRLAAGLVEYARRGLPISDFALQNSLIGLIFEKS